jgi:proton-dependent oligopeptide transporter, POT family
MNQPDSPGILRSYPRSFWIANVMELFERAAYYGLNSVLAIYLTASAAEHGLGFTEESVGFLQGLIYACTYVVPILGGALADRYGYRRMLLIAFSLLASGYFISGNMSGYGLIFLSLLVMATGAGLFKPIISGTIARTTTEKTSGLGFGIYYWMINLGAFVAPLIVSILRGFSWTLVFVASSIYCALMLIPAGLLYREPPRPENTKSLRDVLTGAVRVLGDARFMLMIVIYSGFWILYFQNFGSVLWFLRDFIDPAPVNEAFRAVGIQLRFAAEHVTVINAGTIILLQVLVSRIVRNVRPLYAMVAGIGIGVAGFVCLSFATSVWIFILGIAVFSIGEMTAHPKYYSYVGIVAPHESKAVYMGYAFLYGVIGSLIGSSLGGAMYETWLKPLVGNPAGAGETRTFWLIFAVLGLVAMFGLMLYNRYFADNTPEANRQARRVMVGIYSLLLVLGIWFSYRGLFGAAGPQYRMVVQAALMIALGGGGLGVSVRGRQ